MFRCKKLNCKRAKTKATKKENVCCSSCNRLDTCVERCTGTFDTRCSNKYYDRS